MGGLATPDHFLAIYLDFNDRVSRQSLKSTYTSSYYMMIITDKFDWLHFYISDGFFLFISGRNTLVSGVEPIIKEGNLTPLSGWVVDGAGHKNREVYTWRSVPDNGLHLTQVLDDFCVLNKASYTTRRHKLWCTLFRSTLPRDDNMLFIITAKTVNISYVANEKKIIKNKMIT